MLLRQRLLPISPATSASRPLKTMSQSANSLALHWRTTSFATRSSMGVVCFQRTASSYGLPAERDDAPRA
jgi:hypothetical protein